MDFMLNGVDSIPSSHRYGIENTRRYAIINMKSLSFCLVEKTFQVKFCHSHRRTEKYLQNEERATAQ